MNVVITNATMVNGGDAAIVYSMIDILRRTFGDDVRVSVIDTLAAATRRYYPDLDVRQSVGFQRQISGGKAARLLARIRRRLKRECLRVVLAFKPYGIDLSRLLLTHEEYAVFRRYANAELVISVGGTYLVDHYDITPRLIEFDIALALGKRPLFFTQSLGPFKKSHMRDKVTPYFNRSPLILLRDERSRACLDQLGIAEEKMHVLADSVFGLANPDILRMAAANHQPVRRVAISVRSWSHFKGRETQDAMAQYIDGIARAAETLVRSHGCEILFISTCQGIEEYQNKDSRTAELVVAAMDPELVRDRVRVDSGFHSPSDLIALIEHYDLVIATRMHMAIMALCTGIPVLPIAYEFKTEELFRRLGMGNWVTAIEDVTPETFPAHLEAFLTDLPKRRAELFAAVEQEHVRALRAGPLLAAARFQASGQEAA